MKQTDEQLVEVTQADRDAAAPFQGALEGWFLGKERYGTRLEQAFARHREAVVADAVAEERQKCAAAAREWADSCAQARGNAGAQNDRYGVWQAEAERLASLSIAGIIEALP